MAQEQTKKLDSAGFLPAASGVAGGTGNAASAMPLPPPLPPPLPAAAVAAPAAPPAAPAPAQKAAPDAEAAPRRVARRRPAGPVRNGIAANDDAPSIGGLIYALEQKPSNKPFNVAWIASAVWAAIGGAFAWVMLSGELAAGAALTEILTRPAALMLVTAIVVPMALMWFVALLAWRAEELRLRSSTMTEVAIRLAEPDRMAEQSVASLGQAVRRQVSFMNDAVSRALGRAGELEALVHSEVAALERSYEENERRIRGLIQELSGERHALLNTSDKVSETLRAMGSEVPALIEKLSLQQMKLTQIIQGAGDNLTSLESAITQSSIQLEGTVMRTSDHFEGAIARGTQLLEGSLGRTVDRLEGSLGQGVALIESQLGHGAERIEVHLGEMAGRIEGSIGDSVTRLEGTLGDTAGRMEAVLEGYTAGIGEALEARTEALENVLGARTDQLQQAIGSRTDELQAVLGSRTEQLQAVLGSRTEEIQGALESYTGALGEALASRSEQLQSMFDGFSNEMAATLAARTDNLQTVFEEYTRALDTTLSNRTQIVDNQLIERTKALDSAFSERLRLFDESIMRSTLAIDAAVGERQRQLGNALEAHATKFRDTVQQQTVNLDESLMHGINAVRRSSENITKQSLKAIEGLANQSDMLKNVSENLLGQISAVTNRFETQGQQIIRAASTLETVNQKIDQTLQHRHADLNTTLQRLSGKADEFGRFIEGYSSALEGSLTEAELRARAAAEELKASSEFRQREALADLHRLKSEADAESERQLAELRNRFSSVTTEVSQQLGSLTNRFDETSEEVRQRTARAAAELAEEQARLRREMERLPAATRESADAMRRALGDQLKALEQLSSFTSRAALERDVSPPMSGISGALGLPAPTSGHGAPAGSRPLTSLSSTLEQELSARQQQQASRPVEAASQGQMPQSSGTPQQSIGGAGLASLQTTRPAPSAPVPMMPAGAGGHAVDPGRDGWKLGDLLKRASFDDDGAAPSEAPVVAPMAAPPHMPAPVAQQPAPMQPFALNVEAISRALDPATASAIWSRFRSGQRGIMVRSIYTNEGRAAFDEVSRRYKIDADLKRTIDRYLADFERIVKDAEQKDPSGRLAQSQFVSDMGRVYLFLSHASGRLS